MQVPEITVDELAERMDAGTVVLVDVRRPDEYESGHVSGAVLVPLDQVPAHDFPRDQLVHLICRSGQRSMRAAEFLRAQGVDAVNVGGGTLAWMKGGRAVVVGSDPS
jgi:rhodanese-related sulfurtransferase